MVLCIHILRLICKNKNLVYMYIGKVIYITILFISAIKPLEKQRRDLFINEI